MKKLFIAITCFIAAMTAAAQDRPAALPDTAAQAVDLPESFSYDIDSLMDAWFAKQYLTFDEDCFENSANPTVSDEEYARRLASLPTIIDMPYNSITRNSIDAYVGRNRKIISFALGMLPIYEDIFVDALMKYDVPLELKYLPIVESALKPKA